MSRRTTRQDRASCAAEDCVGTAPWKRWGRIATVAAALAWPGLSAAVAQEDTLPELPETPVEATPTVPDVNLSNQPYYNPQNYDPIADGGRFNSPLTDGYRPTETTTGSLISLPDADIPFTVSPVTRDTMRDQLAWNLPDVVRNVPGVTLVGNGNFPTHSYIRGLEISSRNYRKDGFLDPTYVPRDFQNVERIEFLKGPASVTYGASDPAGLVNVITKKPLDASFTRMGYQFGSWSDSRWTLDTNGRGTNDGAVLYRVNVAQEEVNSFREYNYISRVQVAPTVTWNLSDSTRLTWVGEYHRDHRRGDQGIPAVNGDPLALPISRYVGQPANDFFHYEEFRQSLMLTSELNDNWTYYLGGNSLFYSLPGSTTAAAPPVAFPLYGTSRTNFVFDNEQSQSMITNLAGDFYTGGLRHRTVIGMEYIYFDSASRLTFGTVGPVNVLAPAYTNPPAILTGAFDTPVYRQQRVGGYLQDLVDLNDFWKVFGGVRFDTAHQTFDRTLSFGPINLPRSSEQTFNHISPRAGLIFQPLGNEMIATYFNYSQSFVPPPAGAYLNPGDLKPVLGETYESGIKLRLLENLSFNVAGFYTERENSDVNASSTPFLTQVGVERSRGCEMSLLGNFTPEWSWIANYTYVDVRLFDPGNPMFDGQRQRNIPYNTLNFWTRYNLLQSQCETLGVALGMVTLGDRPGNFPNTLVLPAFCRWDSGLYYTYNQWFMNAYFENIFGTRYAQSSINETSIYPGAPFNARCQVGVMF